MEELIFGIPSFGMDNETIIFVESIRKFAGKYAKSPIWIFIPGSEERLDTKWRKRLENLNVQFFFFTSEEYDLNFPFVAVSLSASLAEEKAKGKTKCLAWLDVNNLIFSEPKEFILKDGINLGYRPVHHTLVGSIYDQPVDSFWELIYTKCNVDRKKIFPMKTHVDGNVLRPYINSGFLIVKPEREFLRKWWDSYKLIYNDEDFKEYYKKSTLYITFIHQAVLSAIMIQELKKEEIHELPFDYNYPIHLFFESSKEYQPNKINDLITARFYLNKLEKEDWRNQLPIDDPLKKWLFDKVDELAREFQKITKVKFGKVPLIYPIPIVLVGAQVDGKPNFEEVGDVAVMGINPAIVCISSGNNHHTNKGILEHQNFTINIPSTKLLSVTDYCGNVSGKDVDKSTLFKVFYGELETAPMIQNCPVNIECKVIKEFSIQHRQIFIGEVIQAYVNEEFVTESDGKKRIADLTKLDPIIYALDNKYYKIGEQIGLGYQEAKKFKE